MPWLRCVDKIPYKKEEGPRSGSLLGGGTSTLQVEQDASTQLQTLQKTKPSVKATEFLISGSREQP